MDDLPRKGRRRAPALPGPKRRTVLGQLFGAHLSATVPLGDHDVDEQVEPLAEQASRRTAHQRREHREMAVPVDRPRPCVADDKACDPLGTLLGRPHPDRAAPVLDRECQPGELEPIEERHDDLCVLLGQPAVARPRRREPEAGIVERDAPVPVHQRRDRIAVDERPRRVPVQEQDRGPGCPHRRSGRCSRRSPVNRLANGNCRPSTHSGRRPLVVGLLPIGIVLPPGAIPAWQARFRPPRQLS